MTREYKRTISVDFDGVLHAYDGTWLGPTNIGPDAVPGSIPWLYDLLMLNKYDVVIFSARNESPEGILAMRRWLLHHLSKEEERRRGHADWSETVDALKFPWGKPKGFIHIDDRTWRFGGPGTLPPVDRLEHLDAWWKRMQNFSSTKDFLAVLAELRRNCSDFATVPDVAPDADSGPLLHVALVMLRENVDAMVSLLERQSGARQFLTRRTNTAVGDEEALIHAHYFKRGHIWSFDEKAPRIGNVNELVAWSRYDGTGTHPEFVHEVSFDGTTWCSMLERDEAWEQLI